MSIASAAFAWVFRTTGILRRRYAGGPDLPKRIAAARAAPVPEPSAKLRRKLDIARDDVDGRAVWRIRPRRDATATILYWHGGGYIYPITPIHWHFLATMAERYGWDVTVPLYPLAPEATAAEVTAFALTFYKVAVREPGIPFVMAGDSAGAGLAAATAMAARDAGLATADGLILICPWLDAAPTHPDQQAIEPRDAILAIRGIAEAGLLYAGPLPLSDPRVSPLHGHWDGLPPILAFGGSDDILVTDARALAAMRPDIRYREGVAQIHDWPIFRFPESRVAQAEMAAFAAGLAQDSEVAAMA